MDMTRNILLTFTPNCDFYPLQAHQEDDGYPELGGVRSADFSLLKEDLEWEAAFNFLLPYQG